MKARFSRLVGRFAGCRGDDRRADRGHRRLRAEPLEDRCLLAPVTWTIDPAQSSLSLAVPDQDVDLDGIPVTVRVRNQSGGNSGPWNVGNTAAIAGTISTDYVDGNSIRFLAGQPDMVGVSSGSYRPNPADFDPDAIDGDNPHGSFVGSSTAPAVYAARVRASVSFITTDAGYFAFSNTHYELASAALPIAGGSFAASALNVGIVSSDLAVDGISVFLIGQPVPDMLTTVDDITATNSAAAATIADLGGHERRLTIPLHLNLSLPMDDDPAHDLTATATGQIVATTTLAPEITLDVDGNGTAEPLSDGVLTVRYLFDPQGPWSVDDVLGAGATRTTREAVASYLDAGQGGLLDVDGNGAADALSDGILILRYLFEPAGTWNVADALGPGATRTTAEAIREYLDELNPGLTKMGGELEAAIGAAMALAEPTAVALAPVAPPRPDETRQINVLRAHDSAVSGWDRPGVNAPGAAWLPLATPRARAAIGRDAVTDIVAARLFDLLLENRPLAL